MTEFGNLAIKAAVAIGGRAATVTGLLSVTALRNCSCP